MPFGLPNIEQSISKFLEGKKGITLIRAVEWDKKYLWTVDFKDIGEDAVNPPPPFDDFFPANDVSLPVSIIESNTFDLPQSSIKLPYRSNTSEITVTFYDDEKKQLLKWFKDWMELDLMNDGRFVSGLQDNHKIVTNLDSFGVMRNVRPIRPMRIALLDAFKDEVMVWQCYVYPEGNLEWNGGQGSDAQLYTLSFVVVKMIDEKAGKGFSLLSADGLKETLGRFI